MKTPQIDLNTVKEALKKLSFLKNNLPLLASVLLVIVAALLFVPTKLLSNRLKNTVTQQSVKAATDIKRLIGDVKEAGQAEAMEEYLNAYAQDPCSMETLMARTTMRELLSYRLFPDDPNETSPLLFDPFRRDFLAGVETMIERLGAGEPPLREEIDAALERSRGPSRAGRGRATDMGAGAYNNYPGGAGQGRGLGSYRMMGDMDRRIVDKLCEERAKTTRVYASPADLEGYSFWSDWKFEDWNTALRQCWYWQMGYWVLEDVADTVQAMNQSGSCVLDSPVKRLLSVGFALSKQGTRMVGGRRGRGVRRVVGQQEMPSYVINLKSAMATPPCTGRFCTEAADVMHFEVRVLVSADQVTPFIQELCSAKTHTFRGWYGDQPEQTFKHNQITVLETSVIPVDLESPDHGSYRYGPSAIVELDLICEYLFVSAGYEEVKPQVIKDDILGIKDDAN